MDHVLDYLATMQRAESAFHADDEEARIFTEQNMPNLFLVPFLHV